jgi:hypothetical protein
LHHLVLDAATLAGELVLPHPARKTRLASTLAQVLDPGHVKAAALYAWSDAALPDVVAALPSSVVSLRVSCDRGLDALATYKRFPENQRGISDDAIAALAPCALRLLQLDLRWNRLTDVGVRNLLQFLPALRTLNLSWNQLFTPHLLSDGKCCVTEIDLRSNPLADPGVACVMGQVDRMPELTTLGLGETSLTDAGVGSLALAKATSVDLSENILTDQCVESLGAVLDGAQSLRCLAIRGFLFEPERITDFGFALLHPFLAGLTRLDELVLDYQQLGCGAAILIAATPPPALRTLSLFNTDLRKPGADALLAWFSAPDCALASLNAAQCLLPKDVARGLAKGHRVRVTAWGNPRCSPSA